MVISEFFASIGFKVDTKGADGFNTYLDNLEKKMRNVRESAVKLNRSLQNATKVKGKLNEIGSARSTSSAAKQITNLNNATTSGAAKIVTYTGKLHNLAVALNRVSASAARVHLPQGNLRFTTAVAGASGARKAQLGAGSAVGAAGMASMLKGPLGTIAGFALSAAGATQALMMAVQVGRKAVASELSIKGGSPSIAIGEENLKFAKQTAYELGLPLNDSMEQFGKIVGAAVGSGLDNTTVQKIFKGISEFGVSRQVDPERMQLSLRAVGQMMSKQKISAEELKGQFAEHLPGALGIAASALGTSVPEMLNMMANGELFAKDLLPKMADEMARVARANGALKAALETSRASQTIFNNRLTEFSTIIYKKVDPALSQMFFFLGEKVKYINELMSGVDDKGEKSDLKTPEFFTDIAQRMNALGGIALGLFGIINKFFMEDIPSVYAKAEGLQELVAIVMQISNFVGFVRKYIVLILEDFLLWASDSGAETVLGDFFDSIIAYMTDEANLQAIKDAAYTMVSNFVTAIKDAALTALPFGSFIKSALTDKNPALGSPLIYPNSMPIPSEGSFGAPVKNPAWAVTINNTVQGNADAKTVEQLSNVVPYGLGQLTIPK